MQLFILIRGHQGSGKSTFAAQKIAEFQQQYPQAEIVHIENDLLMTDAQGAYHWSPELLKAAQARGERMMRRACKHALANPQQAMLIINSNTNQTVGACRIWLEQAKKYGLSCETYCLSNFFPNRHAVEDEDVIAAYLRIRRQRVSGEIAVSAVRGMSAALRDVMRQMQTIGEHDLPFDEVRQTYVSEQYLRLERLNFVSKTSSQYPDLRLLKYSHRVKRFDAALLEMRGLVLDKYNHIIVRPFKKVFNYSERLAKNSRFPLKIEDSHCIDAVVKVDGFLGCCTFVDLPHEHPSYAASFNRQVLYSTTDSLDNSYAQMTKKHCQAYEALFRSYPNHTFLFEINDAAAPHTIQEALGETLIGAVEVISGNMFSQDRLDEIGETYAIRRPARLRNICFGELKELLKSLQHEGFMVFDSHSQALLFQLKSSHYLISTFFSYNKKYRLEDRLNKHRLGEAFYPLIEHIQAQQKHFNQLNEAEKIDYIRRFLQEPHFLYR